MKVIKKILGLVLSHIQNVPQKKLQMIRPVPKQLFGCLGIRFLYCNRLAQIICYLLDIDCFGKSNNTSQNILKFFKVNFIKSWLYSNLMDIKYS